MRIQVLLGGGLALLTACASGKPPVLRVAQPAHLSDTASIHVHVDDTSPDRPRPKRRDVAPRWPSDATVAASAVVAAFVIGADGRAELPTVAFLESDDPAFERSVCAYLQVAEFVPGRVAGIYRRTLVVMPFRFAWAPATWREPDMPRYLALLRTTPRSELLGSLSGRRGCPRAP